MRFAELPKLLRSLDLEDEGLNGPRRPARDDVRTVQNSLMAWLADEEFYLDCIELELAALGRKTPAMPAPAFCRLGDPAMTVRMFYWWPGKVAAPHEHTAWTVTAVFYNTLEVTTYDWDVAFRERRLERKNLFTATQGRAGHIYERCIHSPANPGRRVSTSIHVFNASDEPRIEHEVGPIAGMGEPSAPRAERSVAELDRTTQLQLRVLARMVTQFRSERALGLLTAIAASGDAQTQGLVDLLGWSIRRRGTSKTHTQGEHR